MANQLADSSSPYLRQHANNPVNWLEWGEAAFAQARNEDKPLLVSIGYATCHWCHVMAHECFEDREIAALLNERFVPVKVDREQQPDVDAACMAALQLLSGGGGWPLNVFMTPGGEPFFAGTYFPKQPRLGQPGFADVLERIYKLWQERREDVLNSASSLGEAVRSLNVATPRSDKGYFELMETAYNQLKTRYDEEQGGFGERPKFPSPHQYLFLLRWWYRTTEKTSLDILEKSLLSMYRGGIWDQLGGGIHRYATDREWRLPHFEKMLYDQALLLMLTGEAYAATGKGMYARMACELVAYLERELLAPEGAYYAAEDADSEGEEGKFYVWTRDEISEILADDSLTEEFCHWYQVQGEGNYREEVTGELSGRNVLHLREPDSDYTPELRVRLEGACRKLFERRAQRVRPERDEKILTDWNGLLLGALARSGRLCRQDDFIGTARRVADYLLQEMRDPSTGKLYHSRGYGHIQTESFLGDYVFLAFGCLELYEATLEHTYLNSAKELMDRCRELFETEAGYVLSEQKQDGLLFASMQEVFDGAMPSGNSMALYVLLRLGQILGSPELMEAADRLAQALGASFESAPAAHCWGLCALDIAAGPTPKLSLMPSENGQGADKSELLAGAKGLYHPRLHLSLAEHSLPAEMLSGARNGDKWVAQMCVDSGCEAPVADLSQIRARLKVI